MKILLIEDDKTSASILKFQLNQEMHDVDICHDGRDGLDLFLQDGVRSGAARPNASDNETGFSS